MVALFACIAQHIIECAVSEGRHPVCDVMKDCGELQERRWRRSKTIYLLCGLLLACVCCRLWKAGSEGKLCAGLLFRWARLGKHSVRHSTLSYQRCIGCWYVTVLQIC